jgi:hypothetical protein
VRKTARISSGASLLITVSLVPNHHVSPSIASGMPNRPVFCHECFTPGVYARPCNFSRNTKELWGLRKILYSSTDARVRRLVASNSANCLRLMVPLPTVAAPHRLQHYQIPFTDTTGYSGERRLFKLGILLIVA